jgi:rhodanese-related sulfurtransferase
MLLKYIWQSLLIVIIGAAVGFGINTSSSDSVPLVREPKPEVAEEEKWLIVTADEVKSFIETGEAIILDARAPAEYEAGHIETAVNVPVDDFDNYLDLVDSLPREGFPIVVYCQGGNCDQSHDLLNELEMLGFTDLMLYQDGWNVWRDLGYPAG